MLFSDHHHHPRDYHLASRLHTAPLPSLLVQALTECGLFYLYMFEAMAASILLLFSWQRESKEGYKNSIHVSLKQKGYEALKRYSRVGYHGDGILGRPPKNNFDSVLFSKINGFLKCTSRDCGCIQTRSRKKNQFSGQ